MGSPPGRRSINSLARRRVSKTACSSSLNSLSNVSCDIDKFMPFQVMSSQLNSPLLIVDFWPILVESQLFDYLAHHFSVIVSSDKWMWCVRFWKWICRSRCSTLLHIDIVWFYCVTNFSYFFLLSCRAAPSRTQTPCAVWSWWRANSQSSVSSWSFRTAPIRNGPSLTYWLSCRSEHMETTALTAMWWTNLARKIRREAPPLQTKNTKLTQIRGRRSQSCDTHKKN